MAKETTQDNVGLFNDEVQTTEFFDSLDSNPNQATQVEGKAPPSDSGKVEDELEKRVKKIEERYGASSKEAQKLRERFNELEPFIPILDEMKSDPMLVQKVRDYLENRGRHESPVEALGLGEDFVFDLDEAIHDPNSESGKVLSYMIEQKTAQVNERKDAEREIQLEAQKQAELRKQFIKDNKLNDSQVNELDEFVKGHKLTYDDVWYLMNRGKNEKLAAEKAQRALVEHLKKVRGMNGDVLGKIASVPVDTENDDIFFNKIFGEPTKGLFG